MKHWHEDGAAADRPVRRTTAAEMAREAQRPLRERDADPGWSPDAPSSGSGRSRRPVEVTVFVRRISGKAMAVWDGVGRDDTVDPRDGRPVSRERWAWLPLSLVTRPAPSADPARPETIEVPEWLAKERGLV